MEGLAPWHLLVILLVIVLFFGGKKIPEMMRGLGAGVKSFKEGMREGDSPTNTPSTPSTPSNSTPTEDRK
jgi:sec-independent protein translocase protein TatA